MATSNPTPIGGNDPSVFRQIEAQNAALQQRPRVASAPTLSSSGVSLTPIVSGNETLFPQSTTTTSSDAVTITSSVNNDSGDITTVYATGGAITVNPVNQTINYYTATDSGVSQIIAGSGVTITSTGNNGTGIVTINSSGGGNYTLPTASAGTLGGVKVGSGLSINGSGVLSTTVGNIATTNYDGNASNVLHGDGSWSADITTYGNSNVVTLLGAFGSNTVVTTGNITAGNANLGNLITANYANLAFDLNANVVDANYLYGDGSNITNLPVGNIASINLDGSSSNVLYGNGVFAPGGGGGNTGNFIFANATMSTPDEDVMLIQTTDNNSLLRTQMRFNPDLGRARMAARSAENNSTFTNSNWTIGEYTSQQVNFVDAPAVVAFLETGAWNAGVDKTFSINGGNRLTYQGYSAGGNNATVYTDVTADPDPTTVTSIDFYYQLESYFEMDEDDGDMGIYATGLTINIDNDQTSGPDINIRSGDDILIQAKDKPLGSESEGGDINIYAGDGADDDGAGNNSATGGDIQIYSGVGGDGNTGSGSQGGTLRLRAGEGGVSGVTNVAGQGGYVEIWGGAGGPNNGDTNLGAAGGYVDILAGDTTLEGTNGGNVSIRSGTGGANALAGNVQIITPSSGPGGGGTWTFDGNGLLTLPGGDVQIGTQYGSPSILASNVAFGIVSQGSSGMSALQWNDDVSNVSQISSIYINDPTGNVGDIQVRTGPAGNANVWIFGSDGLLTLPEGAIIDTLGNNFEVRAVENVNFEANAVVNIYTDGSGNAYQWQFGDDGILNLAGGNSTIQSVANNAGDLSGLSTLNLVPDSTTGDDRYIIVDPTGPNHIHIRAGGVQDGSNSLLFLGGDQAYTRIDDFNHEVQIGAYDSANTTGYSWSFGNTGTLTIPGNLVASGASPAPTLSGFSSLSAADVISVGNANIYSNGHIAANTASFSGNVSGDVALFNDLNLNNLGTNAFLYTDSNRDVYDTQFGYDSATDTMSGGNISLTGNISALNIGNASAVTLDGNVGNVLTGNGTFVALPVINANTVVWSTAPVANTSNGSAGQAAYDAGGNLYVCVATDTWAKFTGTTSW